MVNSMNKPIIVLLAVFVLLFAGCASLENLGGQETTYPGIPSSSGKATNDFVASPAPYAPSTGGNYAGSTKVIKAANARIEVPAGTLDDKYASLKEKITSAGGQIVSADYYETGSTKTYNMMIKVKPSEFESLSALFKSIGTVKSMNSNVQEVSEQYTDIEIRIKNLEVQRDRITALLDRNGTLEDILSVENELNRVQTEIEMYQTQKLNLDRRIDMSGVNVELYEEAPAVDKNVFEPLKEIGNVFLGALGFGILALTGLAGLMLPLLVVLLVLYLIYRKFIRQAPKDKPAQNEKRK